MIFFWIIVFILSLALLVKSADWFVESAEKIGLAFKISPFIIGVTIVAIGTSFPELISSLFAVFKGATEIVVANALGSNIANILLIIGLSAIVARRLIVKRSLIDLDAPLLATTTVLFVFIMWDRKVVAGEGIILLLAFVSYFLYTIFYKKEEDDDTPELVEVLPSRIERRKKSIEKSRKSITSKIKTKDIIFLILGIAGLALGANYIIDSVIKISELLNISTSLIALTAVAVGTSLPELAVSVKSALKKKYEIALGNIFGSNVFNVLLVVGVPSLIRPLKVDDPTFLIGLPFLGTATLLFVISGISRRIHIWEGTIYILIYVLFLIKLYGIF